MTNSESANKTLVLQNRLPVLHRRGLTLVEVLVVLAVVGCIVAIILPTVQSAREKERKAHCANNLKQISLSLHTYLDATGVLPPAILLSPESKFTPSGRAMGTTGMTLLLCFYGHGSLYDQYDFNYGAVPGTVRYPDLQHPPPRSNLEVMASNLQYYSCPSDVEPTLANNLVLPGICVDARKSNYLLAAGSMINPRLGPPGAPENKAIPFNEAAPFYPALFARASSRVGMFGHNGAATLKQIRDGLSNTIMVGESLQNHDGGDRTAVVWGQGKLYGQMGVVDGLGVPTPKFPNPPPSRTTINHREPSGQVSPAVLSSWHRRGVNVALADASVRFLQEDIAVEVYNSLFMIRDGDDSPDESD